MKYRRKPTIIEAEQYRANLSIIPRGVCLKTCLDGGWVKPHVHTMHHNQAVILEDGDWILPEPDGIHFYPCKPEVFEATYEAVEHPSPITKLPDGSAFFTTDVMTREEAMRLPVEKRPICFRISSEMYHALFEAIGAASGVWQCKNQMAASDKASNIAVKLCFKIAEELERQPTSVRMKKKI